MEFGAEVQSQKQLHRLGPKSYGFDIEACFIGASSAITDVLEICQCL
jgi:hypothetical protein